MIRWRKSAALRLSLAYTACLALGVIVLGAVTFWAMHRAFEQQIDSGLLDEATSLGHEYNAGQLERLREAIAYREAMKLSDPQLYALFDRRGEKLAGSFPIAMPPLGHANILFLNPREGPDWTRAVTVQLHGGLRLVVAVDSDRMEWIDRAMITAFAIALVGVLALGAVGTLLFAQLLRSRLGRLAQSAEAISAGAVSARMPVGPNGDEFDSLATSLNAMLERIEALIDNLRQVSSALAHDLRTPLTRLRQRVEAATETAQDPASERLMHAAVEQVDEVLSLFGAILHVSEVESGAALPMATVNLSALATEIAESYEPAVREEGRELSWRIAPLVFVYGSRELLAQALSNLIENAIRHTPPGTRIAVVLGGNLDEVGLAVHDDGPGIPEADRQRALRRFERLDSTRASPGFGLGLTFVDAVARRHGGSLELADAAPGLITTITIPTRRRPELSR